MEAVGINIAHPYKQKGLSFECGVKRHFNFSPKIRQGRLSRRICIAIYQSTIPHKVMIAAKLALWFVCGYGLSG
ncbi:hypothetical protein TMES_00220 [Thalassospira mesophila]|uniref:Uncharacterized protein n=1 Tax=Thalassospira mesophila TaxID=1293891 RepID=A0A1Y2L3A5_9PROT|nr:hypothetical protein TMES_00220 [Thalassospira mesophila]